MVRNELMGYPKKFLETMIYKEKIISWLEDRKRNKAIRNIRETMAFFGCDLSDLSDEEIEEKAAALSGILKNFGIAVEEATKKFELASRGLSRHNYKERKENE